MRSDPGWRARLRARLGQRGLIAAFGAVYAVSQAAIAVIVAPLGLRLLELQLTAVTAERVRAIFADWERAGVMDRYRAHFAIDGVHWIWYAGLLTTALCRLFERHRVPHRFDAVLLLPWVAGLCDVVENRLQRRFAGAPGGAAIVDPLPLWSTIASGVKWSLAAACVGLVVALLLRRPRARLGVA